MNIIQKENELNEKIDDLFLFGVGVKKLVKANSLSTNKFNSNQIEKMCVTKKNQSFFLIILYENSQVFLKNIMDIIL